jgi:hypothetical protein
VANCLTGSPRLSAATASDTAATATRKPDASSGQAGCWAYGALLTKALVLPQIGGLQAGSPEGCSERIGLKDDGIRRSWSRTPGLGAARLLDTAFCRGR